MQSPSNPFTAATLRESHRTFSELVAACRAGTVDPLLVATAEEAVKSQEEALKDLGLLKN